MQLEGADGNTALKLKLGERMVCLCAFSIFNELYLLLYGMSKPKQDYNSYPVSHVFFTSCISL